MNGEQRLLQLPRFATDTGAFRPGLDRIEALLKVLGNPHLRFPAIHVAGTNGKGSTCAIAAGIAGQVQDRGLHIGLHISPHLLTVRERMQVDGRPCSEQWLDTVVGDLEDAFEAVQPSFYEATLALALAYFAAENVDLAVVEVGLGGRLDATNVVQPVASVVTHIGLDHTDLLGETLAEIAVEKAGIARAGVPLLHAVQDESARAALEAEAQRRGAPVEAVRDSCALEVVSTVPLRMRLRTPVGDYGLLEVGLSGAHQAWNAALAVRAVEVALGDRLAKQDVEFGIEGAAHSPSFGGRSQSWSVDPRVILDVAHNPDGWRAALEAVRVPEGGQLWVLAGLMADKDVDALAEVVAPRAARVLVVGLEGDRACPANAIVEAFARHGLEVGVAPSVELGVRAFRSRAGERDRLLVTGSHQMVAAVLSSGAETA